MIILIIIVLLKQIRYKYNNTSVIIYLIPVPMSYKHVAANISRPLDRRAYSTMEMPKAHRMYLRFLYRRRHCYRNNVNGIIISRRQLPPAFEIKAHSYAASKNAEIPMMSTCPDRNSSTACFEKWWADGVFKTLFAILIPVDITLDEDIIIRH